ncbi:Ankyrin_repeat-containing domain superfamily [Hexamita inflata]|uniref:Ankyrin repeat-containing domain superfamily n=1 Tax=Hexamita inflata TaxID=28002 RepID=A0AA86NUZ8_9EUKA|nr:Ankyrin repeat-containing domain superfamily [Hexamita inflata]
MNCCKTVSLETWFEAAIYDRSTFLLSHSKEFSGESDQNGLYAIHHSILNNSIQSLKVLLQFEGGARTLKPLVRSGAFFEPNLTVLQFSVIHNNYNVIQTVLNYFVDLNFKSTRTLIWFINNLSMQNMCLYKNAFFKREVRSGKFVQFITNAAFFEFTLQKFEETNQNVLEQIYDLKKYPTRQIERLVKLIKIQYDIKQENMIKTQIGIVAGKEFMYLTQDGSEE